MMTESSENLPVESKNVNITYNQNKINKSLPHTATKLGISENINVLNQDMDPNIYDLLGDTALHSAVRLKNFKILRDYSIYKINYNVKNKKGHTPLHLSVIEGDLDVVEVLLSHNANTNTKDTQGRTLLHDAILKQKTFIVSALLAHNIDVNVRDRVANTPLHYAARINRRDLVQDLVKNNALVNVQNYRGQTPLHYAAVQKDSDVVRILVNNDADVNIRDNKGQTALHLSNLNTRDVLISHMERLNILQLYICQENLDLLSEWNENLDLELIDNFESSRNEELDEMKSQKIDHSSVSFYRFMVVDVHTRANYLNNQRLVDFLMSFEWEKKFPMHGRSLKSRFTDTLRRNKLLKHIHSLDTCIFQNLTHNCIDQVYSYLSNDELRTLIDVIESESSSD